MPSPLDVSLACREGEEVSPPMGRRSALFEWRNLVFALSSREAYGLFASFTNKQQISFLTRQWEVLRGLETREDSLRISPLDAFYRLLPKFA